MKVTILPVAMFFNLFFLPLSVQQFPGLSQKVAAHFLPNYFTVLIFLLPINIKGKPGKLK